MRALLRMPRTRARFLAVGLLVATLIATLPGVAAAQGDEQRLEQAEQEAAKVQSRLNELLQELDGLEAETSALEEHLAELTARRDAEQARAETASLAVGLRVREAFMHGATDPMLLLLGSDSPGDAREHARVLGGLALRGRAEVETASAARIRTEAAADEVTLAAAELSSRRADVDDVRAEVATLLDAAQGEVVQIEGEIQERLAEEERQRELARREREERERVARAAREEASRPLAAAAAPASAQGAPASAADDDADPEPAPNAPEAEPGRAAPAAPAGGIACPVGSPRSYSDTWGASRSGGRSHKGTDILAPMGTAIYAYEDGTISRMNGNRLGGISLYLMGDSGNLYYYTHLQGYVGGLSSGQRVATGQHIALNGDTGNARGIPHLHFEVMPGGGGNVNPYPYVLRACG